VWCGVDNHSGVIADSWRSIRSAGRKQRNAKMTLPWRMLCWTLIAAQHKEAWINLKGEIEDGRGRQAILFFMSKLCFVCLHLLLERLLRLLSVLWRCGGSRAWCCQALTHTRAREEHDQRLVRKRQTMQHVYLFCLKHTMPLVAEEIQQMGRNVWIKFNFIWVMLLLTFYRIDCYFRLQAFRARAIVIALARCVDTLF
jgi:hypothetical protein